jgi:hypothetical protein
MAVEAVHPELARMEFVAEVDRLPRSAALAELDRERLGERHPGGGARYGNDDES